MLAGFVIDLAFIGANGISREHGLTTPDPAVSEVKAQAIRGSRGAGVRGRAHQVRRGQLLPVRRGRRLRDDRHRHRPARAPRPTATRCWAPRSSGSDRPPPRPPPVPTQSRPAPRHGRHPTCPDTIPTVRRSRSDPCEPRADGRPREPTLVAAAAGHAARPAALRLLGRSGRRGHRRRQHDQRPDGQQPADGGAAEAHRRALHQGDRHQGELHRAARRTTSATRSARTSPTRPASTTSPPCQQLRDPDLRPQRLAARAGLVRREGPGVRPAGRPQAACASRSPPTTASSTGEPFYGESSFLMYRKDVFEAKGLTMPAHPTWTPGRRPRGQGRRRRVGHEGHLPARPARLGRGHGPAHHGRQHLRRHLVRQGLEGAAQLPRVREGDEVLRGPGPRARRVRRAPSPASPSASTT